MRDFPHTQPTTGSSSLVVADFGGVNGKVIVTCVLAKAGESGAQVLQSQAQLLGYPSPRYAESGLLCAIDGYPTSGCGTQSGGHYAYWAYWHGGKRWQYANGGPGEWKVSKGDVEGWRFEPDGSATPADPPPRAASSATALETPARAGGDDDLVATLERPCSRPDRRVRQHRERHEPDPVRRERRLHPSDRRRGAASLPARTTAPPRCCAPASSRCTRSRGGAGPGRWPSPPAARRTRSCSVSSWQWSPGS